MFFLNRFFQAWFLFQGVLRISSTNLRRKIVSIEPFLGKKSEVIFKMIDQNDDGNQACMEDHLNLQDSP